MQSRTQNEKIDWAKKLVWILTTMTTFWLFVYNLHMLVSGGGWEYIGPVLTWLFIMAVSLALYPNNNRTTPPNNMAGTGSA